MDVRECPAVWEKATPRGKLRWCLHAWYSSPQAKSDRAADSSVTCVLKSLPNKAKGYSHPSQVTKICSPVGSICLLHEKAARLLPRGQGRRGGKGAPRELQITNNHFSCCGNSRIEPGRTVGAEEGAYKQVPAAAYLACLRAHGAAGHECPRGPWGDAGVRASAAGSAALLLLLVRRRNLAGARSRSPLRVPQAGKVSQPAEETAWLKEPRQLCCR